ncbi:zinc finger protein, putative [Bodo saltans]|uniref:Zinc finger protein, putative n=1 Tax=Bodo saltans TaxID=75058 RepID=A0A0S4J139_BODSA|nr:zinc finger protein, putative [Bodo saltans]|eukprot:CUG43649.1 zinc finger protein, putative [Bodo saltans]
MRRVFASSARRFGVATITSTSRWCSNIQVGVPPNAALGTTLGTTLGNVEGISESDMELIRKSLADPQHNSTSKMGGAGIGPARGEMVAAFTCTVCETRSVKRFTKLSYTKGIVIVECPGCYNKHLLADNLGWFDDERVNIEDILRSRGEEVKRVSGAVYVEQHEKPSADPPQ